MGDDEVDHEFVVEGAGGGCEIGVYLVDLVGEVGERGAECGFVKCGGLGGLDGDGGERTEEVALCGDERGVGEGIGG